MEFDEKSVVPVLEAKYDSFTQSEKNIADFFLKNKNQADYSIETLSQKLFGFRGYREFIYQYEKSLNSVRKDVADSTKTVLDTYQELITKTYSLMNEAQITRVINLLGITHRVIVCGAGSSGLAATEMESRFMRIGIDIDSLTDADRIRMQAVFCNEESLIIGISVSGENESVLYLLKEAHQRGAKTVLITSRDSLFFREFCDEVILISSRKMLNSGNFNYD